MTGTIRTNRGVPKELGELALQQYQSCFIRKGNTLIVRFRDKRDVYVITTKLTAAFVSKTRYQPTTSRSLNVLKPSHIEHYNMNMGSVDAVDQDIEPYNCKRKNYTWFKKVGLHMVQRMVLNAKTFYSIANNQNHVPVLDFTKILWEQILEKFSPA